MSRAREENNRRPTQRKDKTCSLSFLLHENDEWIFEVMRQSGWQRVQERKKSCSFLCTYKQISIHCCQWGSAWSVFYGLQCNLHVSSGTTKTREPIWFPQVLFTSTSDGVWRIVGKKPADCVFISVLRIGTGVSENHTCFCYWPYYAHTHAGPWCVSSGLAELTQNRQ